MRRFKSCLLILVALWLPLQAAAAVTMPFCRHAAEQVALEETMQAAAHCHEQVADAATVAADDFACDNCQMCHLATAGYLLSARETLPPLAANILVSRLEPVSASHIPEPLQQPPRR
jgi:hypothetical protein